jgi:mRNA interferase MazF
VKKGDVVLIPFPFTDLSGSKIRPAVILIVSDSDITLVFITTQLKWKEDFDVALEPTPGNGLKKKSIIRLNKLATLDKELVIGKIGNLLDKEIAIVNRNLLKLFQLNSERT